MKTLFVIGAGASKEVKLPIGAELKKQIAALLNLGKRGQATGAQDTIRDVFNILAYHERTHDFNDLFRASLRICEAMPQAISIDNFLDAHPNDKVIELCGKLAIVHAIISAESHSSMFLNTRDPKLKFEQLEGTWFTGFMQLIVEGCRVSDLEQRLSSIILVIFNYDRCVEHYIYHALQNYYDLNDSDAAKYLKFIKIYHPYGTVGSLPCLAMEGAIEFGAKLNPTKLIALANQIKTFTESTDKTSSDISAIHSHVYSADRLVFLGFAFHHMNMELLLSKGLSSEPGTNRQIFATTLGLSKSDVAMISAELAVNGGFHPSNIHFQNNTCTQLFQEYHRSLSLRTP